MNKILTICLIIVSTFAGAIYIFKIPANTALVYGGILLCPLMHIFMMGHGGHEENNHK